MRKISLPNKSHKGLYVFCKSCRLNNPPCKHYDQHIYRAIFNIPGGGGSKRTKMLKAENYDDAVVETIEFRKELEATNFEKVDVRIDEGNDYNLIGAILKYNQYLHGNSDYAHLVKNITDEYRKEIIYYCKIFAKKLKETKNIERMRVTDVTKKDVASFYTYLETRFQPKTFNKCLNAMRGFFDFLIKIEEIEMKNPFAIFTPKPLVNNDIETITQGEFQSILDAVDTYTPYTILGGKGEKKTMYFPWLKDGFKLFLLTGGRREEVVNLKWSDICVTERGIMFFMIDNLKVNRIKKNNRARKKYIPINIDLEEFLIEMGMNEKKNTNDFIFLPNRTITTKIIMDRLSKSFTHYKKGAGIKKDFSLKNLRKTYITWVEQVMGNQTGILTSHSTKEVLEKFYLDPKVLSAVEEGAMKIKIFGEKVTHESDAKEKITYENIVSD